MPRNTPEDRGFHTLILIPPIFNWFITSVSFPFHTEFHKVCALQILGNYNVAGITPTTQNDKDTVSCLSVLTKCRPQSTM
jgi:hypothetical protein